jgi:serine/threonine protein kinase
LNRNSKTRQVSLYHSTSTTLNNPLTLIPDYYDPSFDLSEKTFNLNTTAHGSFATVFLKYYNYKNKNVKSNIVFKKINDPEGVEYQASIFHYLLYFYYQIYAPEQLQYLCNLYEIGRIRGSNLIYGIMEHCGDELMKIDNYLRSSKNPTPLSKLLLITTIFDKCLLSLKLIHDIGYSHRDIKLENFLIKFIGNEIQVKIIDFGFVIKSGSKITELKGTGMYFPNDYLKNCLDGKATIFEKHHDIFSLGCLFIELLFSLFHLYNSKIQKLYIACPITFSDPDKNYINGANSKNSRYYIQPSLENTMRARENYTLKIHQDNLRYISFLMDTIFKNIKNIKIISKLIYIILYGMVNPDPLLRYKSINEILLYIKSLYVVFFN